MNEKLTRRAFLRQSAASGAVAAVVFAVPQTVWLTGPMSARQKLPITRKRA